MSQAVLPPVPDSLRESLAFNLGGLAAADDWLAGAVRRAEALLEEWDLEAQEVLCGGSFSLCVKCAGPEGELLVLKVPAGVAGGAAELAALRVWGGDGAARVRAVDEASSAMLMDYLGRVGEGDYGLEDVVRLAERLHRRDPGGFAFPCVAENLRLRVDWARERFAATRYEAHRDDLALAEELVAALLSEPADPVLLHGDLQAKNLIVSSAGLTAVDPMPALGPALFDLAFWVAKSQHDRPTRTYVDAVADLRPDLDGDQLMAWTWALAVLENRPYIERGARQRQAFIDEVRDQVAGVTARPRRG